MADFERNAQKNNKGMHQMHTRGQKCTQRGQKPGIDGYPSILDISIEFLTISRNCQKFAKRGKLQCHLPVTSTLGSGHNRPSGNSLIHSLSLAVETLIFQLTPHNRAIRKRDSLWLPLF